MITTIQKFLLLEKSRNIEITLDDVKDKLKSIYTKDEILPIFRGTHNCFDYSYVNPKLYNRRSANTSNYYTLFMDNSELWKEYPKRSQSLVCTTSFNRADFTSNVYILIPLDKQTKFGICKKSDLWNSFTYLLSKVKTSNIFDMDDFNSKFSSLNISDKSYEEMIKDLSKIDNDTLVDKFKLIDSKIFDLNDLLDPIKNEFELKEYSNLKSITNQNREIWTDSDCILIHIKRENDFEEIINNIYN